MADLKTSLFDPDVEVILYKTITRSTLVDGVPVSERFAQIGAKVDLTPYLGDGTAVRTQKSVREAAGGFSITLIDKPFIGYIDTNQLEAGVPPQQISAESVYGIIEPMDGIEIRFRRELSAAGDSRPPVVMRGFVSSISRNENMGANGVPQRTVTFSGQDYGKLWQMLQIRYLPGYVVGEDSITAFRLFERFGVGLATSTKAGAFVKEILNSVLNVYLAKIMADTTVAVNTIVLDEDQLVGHGTTSLTGPQNAEGTIYDVLKTYLDVGTWNELFLEDRADGVYLVYRANPFKAVDGSKILPDQSSVDVVDVNADTIIGLSLSRSDANVANYFWVHAPRFDLVDDMYRKQWAIAESTQDKTTVLLGDYPNCSEALYGNRLMFVDSQMGGDDVTTFNSGLPEVEAQARKSDQVNWVNYRRKALVDMNKDNVLFESGTMRLRGSEKLRAGTYVKLIRGTFEAFYYVVDVAHEYLPFQGFFTTLNVIRGTGFIERVKRNGGKASPYFAELAP